MLLYPQLTSGALSQFPLRRHHCFRTLLNTAADGTVVKLADSGAETIEWQLNYSGLSDVELAALVQFFAATEGTLNSFTFLDPTGNLLAWSDDLSNAVWSAGPLISATAANADPLGGNNAWSLVNAGLGVQDVYQTVMTPGGYLYTLSLYVKAAAGTTVNLLLGGTLYARLAGPSWQRLQCTGNTDPTAASVTFGVELTASTTVEIYGIQVEPQGSPSPYKASTTGGCYVNARFRDDMLSFISTGVNCHSATVNILYASHL